MPKSCQFYKINYIVVYHLFLNLYVVKKKCLCLKKAHICYFKKLYNIFELFNYIYPYFGAVFVRLPPVSFKTSIKKSFLDTGMWTIAYFYLSSQFLFPLFAIKKGGDADRLPCPFLITKLLTQHNFSLWVLFEQLYKKSHQE